MKHYAGISLCDRKFDFYLQWLACGDVNYKILNYHEYNFDDIKECSSLILTGGYDIYPEFCNEPAESEIKTDYVPERDGFEFKLLDYALEHNLPILGICRGLQLINCRMNGNLLNDIEAVRDTKHTKLEEYRDREHYVSLSEGSLLMEIIGEKRGEVNSAHHQGIDRLGDDLIVSAKADDGIIEGIEWEDKNKQFLIGVQWHPERMCNLYSPFSKNLLIRFKEETEKTK